MLPSVLGPATVNKTSAPNFSLRGRSKIGSFHEDLQKVSLTRQRLSLQDENPTYHIMNPVSLIDVV